MLLLFVDQKQSLLLFTPKTTHEVRPPNSGETSYAWLAVLQPLSPHQLAVPFSLALFFSLHLVRLGHDEHTTRRPCRLIGGKLNERTRRTTRQEPWPREAEDHCLSWWRAALC